MQEDIDIKTIQNADTYYGLFVSCHAHPQRNDTVAMVLRRPSARQAVCGQPLVSHAGIGKQHCGKPQQPLSE